MGILDDIERIEEESLRAILGDISKKQERIIDLLETLLKEVRAVRAEISEKGGTRLSRE